MRDYQTFKDLGDIGILYQYLWMDEDNDNALVSEG